MFRRPTTRILTGLAIGSLLLTGAAYAGSITGTVKYDGRVPNLRPLKMDADPQCAAKHSGPVQPELLVLGDGKTLANVFVRVLNVPQGDYPAPSEPVVMDQNGCVYTPHVFGIQVEQPFKIKNSDSLLHNVHSLSKVNAPFNRAMPANVKEANFEFDKSEDMFKIKCDVHPWMGAWVTVIDHPFFDVSGKDGKFEIENLPAGTYEVEARHEFERFPPQKVTVTVPADGAASQDFTFKGPQG